MTDAEILEKYIAEFVVVDPESGVNRRGLQKFGLENFTKWRDILEALYYTETINEAAKKLHYGTTRSTTSNPNAPEKGMTGALANQTKLLGMTWYEALGKVNTKGWRTHIQESVGIKICVVCKESKPLDQYIKYNDRSKEGKYTGDVYMGTCEKCWDPIQLEHNRTWKANNPDTVAANSSARRAKMSMKDLSEQERKDLQAVYAERNRLNEEAGYIKYHVDHIKPLSKGGKHHPDNLQILLAEENLKKSDKYEEV